MKDTEFAYIAISELRLGLTIDLDVGWLKHPFPKSRFKIASPKQIETLQSLGLQRVRYVPSLSEDVSTVAETQALPAEPHSSSDHAQASAKAHATELAATPSTTNVVAPVPIAQRQQDRQLLCEQRFAQAAAAYRDVRALVESAPQQAARIGRFTVESLVHEMQGHAEIAIRLLQKTPTDPQAMHPVNVAVLSVLLGRAMGLTPDALVHLGLAAFLHDVGKSAVPSATGQGRPDVQYPQDHVERGVSLARSMGLDKAVLSAIGQHHAMWDGSGYPARVQGAEMGQAARILSLVNQYDNLCNPVRAESASTPHEALALMFSRMKSRFDGATLASFIRMMGVYPPGSMVQLQDDRYAMVVAVNSARPLKPRVMVQEEGVPRSQAIVLDLEHTPGVGILRSLRPSVLPEASLEYFAPPRNACFYFEAASQPVSPFQSM